MPQQLGRESRPEDRTLHALQTCEGAEGPMFAVLTEFATDGTVERNDFSIIYPDTPYDLIASELLPKAQTATSRLDIVIAHSSAHHDDVFLNDPDSKENPVSRNEVAASFLQTPVGNEPFAVAPGAVIGGEPVEILDPLTSQRVSPETVRMVIAADIQSEAHRVLIPWVKNQDIVHEAPPQPVLPGRFF